MSIPQSAQTFGLLLRLHRLQARLTQEVLAERSGVSHRTILDIEADRTHPRRSTALRLVESLPLSPQERVALLAAATSRPRQRARPIGDVHHQEDAGPIDAAALSGDLREPTLLALPRTPPTNVPWPVSSLLGREGAVTALRRLLVEDHQRLVTLTGVGGAGKTRLAIQVAQDLLSAFAHGVWFVDLAPTSDPDLVPRTVAGVLGVLEERDEPILDTLLEFLRQKSLLLVLDNCEHLIDACAGLADRLLMACPDLHVLATSRRPLQIDGERRWLVRPLAVPDLAERVSSDDLARIASVRVFVTRAEQVDGTFRLNDENAEAVARICTLLAGIPLAIELAAARVSVLTVDDLVRRLEDGFRVLASDWRTIPARQRTMEAALSWSYDLLTPDEQALFRRLGTSAGGFDLEAAEAIVGGDADHSALALLGRLVDASLVVAERMSTGQRFRLLEPVRQYAQQLLLETGEHGDAQTRHAAYYAALAERAAPLLRGPDQIAWLDRLERERNNLRVALTWITKQGEAEDGLRMMVDLVPYWEVRGHFGEGRRWLDSMLERPERLSPGGRHGARLAAGRLAFWHGDLAAAVAHLEDASGGADATAPPDADVLTWLGAAVGAQGAFVEAEGILRKAVALQEARGDVWGAAWAWFNLGRAIGNRATQVTHVHADVLQTSEMLGESLRRFRALGDLRFMAITSMYQGLILVHAGERERPAHLLREGLVGLQAVGERAFLFPCVIALSLVAVMLGQIERAARLLGAAESLGRALGTALAPVNRRTHESTIAQIRPLLSAETFASARADGWNMTPADILSDASKLASTVAVGR